MGAGPPFPLLDGFGVGGTTMRGRPELGAAHWAAPAGGRRDNAARVGRSTAAQYSRFPRSPRGLLWGGTGQRWMARASGGGGPRAQAGASCADPGPWAGGPSRAPFPPRSNLFFFPSSRPLAAIRGKKTNRFSGYRNREKGGPAPLLGAARGGGKRGGRPGTVAAWCPRRDYDCGWDGVGWQHRAAAARPRRTIRLRYDPRGGVRPGGA